MTATVWTEDADTYLADVITAASDANTLDEIRSVAFTPLRRAATTLAYSPATAARIIEDADAIISARLVEWRDLMATRASVRAERYAARAELTEAVA